MTRRLDGKRCVVTGGSRGIGRAIVDRFVAEGARVVVTARSAPPAPFPDDGSTIFVPGDTASTAQADTLIETARDAFGGIDVLVNNAAIQIEKTIVETTDEDWDLIFGINVKGVFATCRAAIPVMASGGGGSIVNVGSYDGFVADPGLAAYCATKGAVHALSRAIAVDHGSEDIRCNVICPGWIKTDMMDAYLASVPDPDEAARALDANQPIGRIGAPRDIANLALWLASDESAFTTGQLMICDGGLTARASQPG
ncbi:MAG: SDR family oxidoreductase [Rhodospirillales bacterium]|nr:SDR family oxidoreductase [Rhodospirillales bacterium]